MELINIKCNALVTNAIDAYTAHCNLCEAKEINLNFSMLILCLLLYTTVYKYNTAFLLRIFKKRVYFKVNSIIYYYLSIFIILSQMMGVVFLMSFNFTV